MFYRCLRAVLGVLLRAFYRIEAPVDAAGALGMSGPVIFVGNHPNGLVDPGLVLVLAKRQITFLAKAPLFSLPIVGALIRALGALPVYRRQDDPSQMGKNAGTLEAAAQALAAGRCITLFPEGKSHSEPQLQELKTGAARIALMAAAQGAKVRIVPLGLTYAEKNLFRSAVHVEVGAPLEVTAEEDAIALTERIFAALRKVTLNLEQWEDLPLLQTAEALYALKAGPAASRAERLKAFARGMALLRAEEPEQFAQLKTEVLSLQRSLKLVDASPGDVATVYRPSGVLKFVLRNLLAAALLPLFALGMVLFAIPFWIPPLVVRLARVSDDVEATVKVLLVLMLAPLWFGLLTVLAWRCYGLSGAAVAFAGTLPLALYTRYYFERRSAALRDARTFFTLGSQRGLKATLAREGEALASKLEHLAGALAPRVS
ncbi:MAG: 1-acyl-sn-glycerol-3-phosphate acyltransferase [Archangiaceae bacterium]|nr:1-acyl-sn-glycerol-3-phosphate acyltransferase [Archangiaceae bacterium]